jgi:hypothetical protein
MGMEGKTADLWKLYVESLQQSYLRLMNEDNTLAWSKKKTFGGVYCMFGLQNNVLCQSTRSRMVVEADLEAKDSKDDLNILMVCH